MNRILEQQVVLTKKLVSMTKLLKTILIDEKTLYFKKGVVEQLIENSLYKNTIEDMPKLHEDLLSIPIVEVIIEVALFQLEKICNTFEKGDLLNIEAIENLITTQTKTYTKTANVCYKLLNILKEVRIKLNDEINNTEALKPMKNVEKINKVHEIEKYEALLKEALFGIPNEN